jgi:hypothetical protein
MNLINIELYIYLHVVIEDANINKIQTQNARYYLFTNIKSIILLQFNIEMSQIMYIEVINITFD